MSSIRKREIQYKVGKDGSIRKGTVYDVYYSYKNPTTGLLKRTSKKGFPTKDDAKVFLVETENKKYQGTFRKRTKLTLKEYIEKWLVMKKQSVATGTYFNYENYTRKHIIPYIGGIYIDELTSEDVVNFRMELLKPEHKLSRTTIKRATGILSTILNSAIKQKVILRNVAMDIEPFKASKKDIPIYDANQIKILLEKVKDSDLECPICLGVFCGMRRGEVLGLKWTDIDEENKTLQIRQQIAITDDGFQLKELKTKSSRRTINIPEVIFDVLLRQRDKQRAKKFEVGKDYNKNNLVCCNFKGKLMNSQYFSEKFGHMIKRHKLPKITFHGLRHSFACLLLNENISIKVISSILGHARASTTIDIYLKAGDKQKAEAADKIDEVFSAMKEPVKKVEESHLKVIKFS